MTWFLRNVSCVAIVLIALVITSDVHAQYNTTGVFYDYTQISVNGRPQFVLVPRGTDAFTQGSPPQLSVPAAFRILRENKRATYGNASLTLSDADLEAGRAVVHIDPEQRDWYLIVVAETVYTFSELGIDEVMFPGLSETPYTRASVPFLAFVLHSPMWRALPGRNISVGIIELPNGGLIESSDFYRRWESGDSELQELLLSYLSTGSPVEQTGVLALLGAESVPGAVEAVMPLLDTAGDSVRLQAVNFLAAAGGEAVLERLSQVMSADSSAEVRNAAAAALGSTGDTHFQFFELEHRLAEATVETLPGILAEFAATGDPRAIAILQEHVSHGEQTVRQAAIDGLVGVGETEYLFQTVEGDSPLFIRLQIGETLASRLDGEARVRAIENLVAAREGQPALDYLNQLIEQGRDGQAEAVRVALERQLAHQDTQIRIEVATALAAIGDPASLEALAAAAAGEGDVDVRNTLDESAVELMTHISLSDVEDHAGGRNLFLKRSAYVALGYFAQQGRANQSTFQTLVEGLLDGEAEIRGAAVLGLATYGNADAFNAVIGLAQDPDPSVRRDVARSLGSFPAGQGSDALAAFLSDSDDNIVAAALLSVGDRQEQTLLENVLQLTSSRSAKTRAAALIAASGLSYQEIEMTVIDMLMSATNDAEAEVRVAAAEALSTFNSEMAVLGISPLTQDREVDVRLRAISALATTQNGAALGVLVSLLEDSSAQIRLAAVRALGDLGMAEAVPQIMAALTAEQDPGVLDAAQSVVNSLQGN